METSKSSISKSHPWADALVRKFAHVALVGRVLPLDDTDAVRPKSNSDFFIKTYELNSLRSLVTSKMNNSLVIEIITGENSLTLLERWEMTFSAETSGEGISVSESAADRLLVSLFRIMVLLSKTSVVTKLKRSHPQLKLSFVLGDASTYSFEGAEVAEYHFPSKQYGFPVIIKKGSTSPVKVSMKYTLRKDFSPASAPTAIRPSSEDYAGSSSSQQPRPVQPNPNSIPVPVNQLPGGSRQPYPGSLPKGFSRNFDHVGQNTRTTSTGHVGSVPNPQTGILEHNFPQHSMTPSPVSSHIRTNSHHSHDSQHNNNSSQYTPNETHGKGYDTSENQSSFVEPYAAAPPPGYRPGVGSIPSSYGDIATSPNDFNRPIVRGRSSSSTSTGVSPYRADLLTTSQKSTINAGLPLDMAGPSPPSYSSSLHRRSGSFKTPLNPENASPTRISPSIQSPSFHSPYLTSAYVVSPSSNPTMLSDLVANSKPQEQTYTPISFGDAPSSTKPISSPFTNQPKSFDANEHFQSALISGMIQDSSLIGSQIELSPSRYSDNDIPEELVESRRTLMFPAKISRNSDPITQPTQKFYGLLQELSDFKRTLT